MKNSIKTLIVAIGAVCIVSLSLISTSCKKDEATKVRIIVIDTANSRVSQASVRVFARSSDGDSTRQIRFDETSVTNTSGEAIFDYSEYTKPGQAGFVVLDIEVSKLDQIGNGIVRVEENKTNEAFITIQ